MKKTTEKILKLALPAAMLLSSGWNAAASISVERNGIEISQEKGSEDKIITEAGDSDLSVILVNSYDCRSGCTGSCQGNCRGSCDNRCTGSCTTTCSGSCYRLVKY